jgi:cell division GTPase FtsZ
MLKVGFIGVGNTGNQIAAIAQTKIADLPVVAINSSQKDLDTIPETVKKFLITDKKGESQGAGKNRTLAKTYLKDSILALINDQEMKAFCSTLEVVFVCGSTGGGTGSGVTPLLLSALSQIYPDTLFILIGIGPVESEALTAQVNTLEYLKELYGNIKNVHYMLYDNDNFDNMPSHKMMEHVNNEVVEDIKVLMGMYNKETRYDSIDTEDGLRLISSPGRIVVARVEDVKEKDLDQASLEERIIKAIKNNAHMELQRDQKVMATGVISNLSEQFSAEFNVHIPRVHELIGEPVNEFLHTYINEDKKEPNSVYLIMTGLSPVNDKITKITERINEIEERQRIQEEASVLDESKIDTLSNMVRSNTTRDNKNEDGGDLNMDDLFNSFGV